VVRFLEPPLHKRVSNFKLRFVICLEVGSTGWHVVKSRQGLKLLVPEVQDTVARLVEDRSFIFTSTMSKSAIDISQPSQLKVAGVVLFYMVAALVMVFVNKAVLNSTPDLPFLFLFIQLIIAVILLHLASFISASQTGSAVLGKVELPLLDIPTAKSLVPLFSVGLLTLVFNTLCLKNVDASFFQIARGLLLPFTIAVSAAYTHNLPGRPSLFAAIIVTIGFFVGLSPSSYFISTSGLSNIVPAIYGCLSALLTAVHAVLMKPAHDIVGNNSVIKLAYWGNLVIALALLPFIVFNGELEPLFKNHDRDWSVFIAGSAVTGLFGFFLSVAGLLSVKVTSPVTHMFSSAARSVLQTILGVVIFGDIVTPSRGGSILIITVGTIYYTWAKACKPAPPPPLPLPVTVSDLEKERKV